MTTLCDSKKEDNAIVELKGIVVESPEARTILTTIFAPFIKKATACNKTICSVSIDKFNRKFKIDSDILSIMDIFKKQDIKFVLAGGKMIHYFENKKKSDSDNDYDIFVTSEDAFGKIHKILIKDGAKLWNEKPVIIVKHYLREYHFQNTKLKFQVMSEAYASPEEVISEFDIRACAIATDGNRIYWMKNTLRDIQKKKLFLMNIKNNKAIFMRIFKYQTYGYELSLPDMGIAALSFLIPMIEMDTRTSGIYLDRNFDLTKLSHYGENGGNDGVDEFDNIEVANNIHQRLNNFAPQITLPMTQQWQNVEETLEF